METVVYLIRHSEAISKGNMKPILVKEQSQLTNEKMMLSVSGEKLALKLSKNPELQNIDAVYSSNYVRALSTAKYIAMENNTIINVDERLNERKIGDISTIDPKDFHRFQSKDFDFKLSGGESINQTKKRMVEAMKNILMFESGNRVVIVSHSTALTSLLSAWCEVGRNYDDEVILTYNDKSIIDGAWRAPMVFKVIFDGMSVLDIECINIDE